MGPRRDLIPSLMKHESLGKKRIPVPETFDRADLCLMETREARIKAYREMIERDGRITFIPFHRNLSPE